MLVVNVQLSGPKSNEAADACFGRFWSDFGHEIRLRFWKCEQGFMLTIIPLVLVAEYHLLPITAFTLAYKMLRISVKR